MQITAAIITYNEAANLARCIASLQPVVDEIVVVDSFSQDGTAQLAAELGARVIQRPFPGHVEQKNFAKDQASYPWVLSLDADECLSPELQASIRAVKAQTPSASGYTMNRLNNYAGKWVRHSGWYPDRKLRLWRKDAGSWVGTNPHDKFELFSGRTEHLRGDLLHYTIHSLEHHKQVIERYTTIAAKAMHQQGQGRKASKRFVSPWFSFFQNYFFRLGFLDGKTGWNVCFWSAYYTWLKYHKLHLLNQGKSLD